MAGHRRGPGRIPEKPKNFKGTIGQLFRYLGRYRLGLALVREIAVLHGGSVTVESSSDCGTTFGVTLPTEQGG